MSKIQLAQIDTRAPKNLDKKEIKEKTEAILSELDELQNLLFAEGKHAVLVVIQGMDGSGKDGAIRNVFTSMNPQGITVKSYKAPTPEELAHDFLWRIHQHAPAKGMIQIFNRSHYEDILITRVHKWCDDATAKKRMQAINDFEKLLQEHNRTHILKFYLHISPEEQKERLTERMKEPAKMWKYNQNDFEEAKLWDCLYADV
jgi:PPK2 family polyphosphate:nucleotide phosphotransferase